MREIVKVQIPIVTTDPHPKAIVYNEDRSMETLTSVTKNLRKKMRGQYKQFFYAHLDEMDRVILEEEAPYQLW